MADKEDMLGDINSRKSGILKGAATRNPYHMPNIEGCRSVYNERRTMTKPKDRNSNRVVFGTGIRVVTSNLDFATWLSARDDCFLRSVSNIGMSRVLYRYAFDSMDKTSKELYEDYMKTKIFDYMARRRLLKTAPEVCVK